MSNYLDQVFDVSVTSATRTPTRAGFGTPLFAVAHVPNSWGAARVRAYNDLPSMEADGFAQTDPAYKMAEAAFSQDPSPALVKIGRRVRPYTQVIRLTPEAPTDGKVYGLRVGTAGAPGREVATNTTPLAVTPGGTLVVAIDGRAPVTATFTATAATLTGTGATYAALGGAGTLDLLINGATALTVNFAGAENSEALYRAAIDTALAAHGATSDAGGQIRITTARQGSSASVAITAASAGVLAALGFAAPIIVAGTGNMANAAALTSVEFASIMNGFLGSQATAGVDGTNHPYVQSATTGATSRVQFIGSGTLNATFGFDPALHSGVAPDVTHVAGGGDNLAAVCTALASAINAACPSVNASGASGTRVDVTTSVAGTLVAYSGLTSTLALLDVTTDPGIATDLSEILAADADWYGLDIDSHSGAEIIAAAAWVEPRRKLFVAQTADSACGDPASTTDVMYTTKATGYVHTTLWYYPAIATATGWLTAGILGDRLPADPGSDNWAWKTIEGVTPLEISATVHNAVLGKNGNTYETQDGVGVTYDGKVAQGEWADVVRGLDWLQVRIKERIFTAQINNEKIAFDDDGIDIIRGLIKAQLAEGQRVKLIAAKPKPRIFAPRAEDVDATDRQNRTLPGVGFDARLAGAINKIRVRGTVSA